MAPVEPDLGARLRDADAGAPHHEFLEHEPEDLRVGKGSRTSSSRPHPRRRSVSDVRSGASARAVPAPSRSAVVRSDVRVAWVRPWHGPGSGVRTERRVCLRLSRHRRRQARLGQGEESWP